MTKLQTSLLVADLLAGTFRRAEEALLAAIGTRSEVSCRTSVRLLARECARVWNDIDEIYAAVGALPTVEVSAYRWAGSSTVGLLRESLLDEESLPGWVAAWRGWSNPPDDGVWVVFAGDREGEPIVVDVVSDSVYREQVRRAGIVEHVVWHIRPQDSLPAPLRALVP